MTNLIDWYDYEKLKKVNFLYDEETETTIKGEISNVQQLLEDYGYYDAYYISIGIDVFIGSDTFSFKSYYFIEDLFKLKNSLNGSISDEILDKIILNCDVSELYNYLLYDVEIIGMEVLVIKKKGTRFPNVELKMLKKENSKGSML